MTGSSSAQPLPTHTAQNADALIGWTQAIYLLHAISLGIGILGAASVVGAFLIGRASCRERVFRVV